MQLHRRDDRIGARSAGGARGARRTRGARRARGTGGACRAVGTVGAIAQELRRGDFAGLQVAVVGLAAARTVVGACAHLRAALRTMRISDGELHRGDQRVVARGARRPRLPGRAGGAGRAIGAVRAIRSVRSVATRCTRGARRARRAVAAGTHVMRRRHFAGLQRAVFGHATPRAVVEAAVDFDTAVAAVRVAHRQLRRGDQRIKSIATILTCGTRGARRARRTGRAVAAVRAVRAVAAVAHVLRRGDFPGLQDAIASRAARRAVVDARIDFRAAAGAVRIADRELRRAHQGGEARRARRTGGARRARRARRTGGARRAVGTVGAVTTGRTGRTGRTGGARRAGRADCARRTGTHKLNRRNFAAFENAVARHAVAGAVIKTGFDFRAAIVAVNVAVVQHDLRDQRAKARRARGARRTGRARGTGRTGGARRARRTSGAVAQIRPRRDFATLEDEVVRHAAVVTVIEATEHERAARRAVRIANAQGRGAQEDAKARGTVDAVLTRSAGGAGRAVGAIGAVRSVTARGAGGTGGTRRAGRAGRAGAHVLGRRHFVGFEDAIVGFAVAAAIEATAHQDAAGRAMRISRAHLRRRHQRGEAIGARRAGGARRAVGAVGAIRSVGTIRTVAAVAARCARRARRARRAVAHVLHRDHFAGLQDVVVRRAVASTVVDTRVDFGTARGTMRIAHRQLHRRHQRRKAIAARRAGRTGRARRAGRARGTGGTGGAVGSVGAVRSVAAVAAVRSVAASSTGQARRAGGTGRARRTGGARRARRAGAHKLFGQDFAGLQ